MGDVIAALPILRALGGGTIVFTEVAKGWPGPRETMRGARYDAIRPLLEAQDYVSGVEWQDVPTGITHDLSRFRNSARDRHENLALWQARHLGVEVSLDPWLTVPELEPQSKVVISRTSRYHNFFFPWADLIRQHLPDIAFVGLKSEHAELETETRYQFPYRHTVDLLELAEVIAGAKLVICNQSCVFWIAVALGVPLIQESWWSSLNSIIPRANAVYTPTDVETRTLMLRLYPKNK